MLGGIILIIFGALICTYTSYQLSENWTILQARWPEYRNYCRKPYPSMGYRAIGPRFKYSFYIHSYKLLDYNTDWRWLAYFRTFVSICLDVTMFGTAVVFLLLAAKNIENILHVYGRIHIDFCYLVLIVGFLMLPLTMLKSPKDFWFVFLYFQNNITSIFLGVLLAILYFYQYIARRFPCIFF